MENCLKLFIRLECLAYKLILIDKDYIPTYVHVYVNNGL